MLTGFVVMLLLPLPELKAQWYDPEKVNRKAYAIYEEAYDKARNGDYAGSIASINEAIAIEPRFVEAFLSRSGVQADLRNYAESVADFELAWQLDSVFSHNNLLPYSISLAGMGAFDKALDAVNRFLTDPTLNKKSIQAGNYRKSVYEFAIQYAREHPASTYPFQRINAGDSINSAVPEYYPSLTIDGKKLVFTRRLDRDEDFYESTFNGNSYSKAVPLKGRINTNFNEGAQTISQDGEWIIFAGCNYPEGYGSCDLYISHKTNQGWSEPENLGGLVNTDYWESAPTLSPDKRDLYFSSSAGGGFGGKDIWVSHRGSNGKWGRPENLGPTINTSGDESCPFIHADNQTLFFNSNGHPGYGEADLFYAKKKSIKEWEVPVNLGYPINTIDEEGSLIVAADGKTAWYASDGKDTRGQLDLYQFELREDIRPQKTTWVKGKVYDANTRQGLPSSVELTDINSRQLISKVQTDEDGNYLTTLPIGKDYAFNVNRHGYLFYSEHYNFTLTHAADSAFTADIPLQPIVAGASIVLKNIFFPSKQAMLDTTSQVELDRVIQLLQEHPQLRILISGHTDNVGKPQDNAQLSNARAKAVVQYLLASRVIAKERLVFKGWGETKPIAPNSTEEGRAMNRRTELTVISN